MFRFTLEYDGTHFEGWQRQDGEHRTVQGTLETALRRLCGAPVPVVGAGRTDAGVHAEAQVASARLETALAPDVLRRALNAHLPPDLAVVGLSVAHPDFHARRDARGKLYRYRIWNGPSPSPLRARRWHAVPAALDLDAMAAGARCLVGTHDFASFQATGSSVSTTRRTITRLEVLGRAGGEVLLEVEGDGFLRHMVRAIAGTLLQVGRGRRPADSLPTVLAARERRAAGPTAPARGLTLVRVDYDSGAISGP